jgi:hypothetical protein
MHRPVRGPGGSAAHSLTASISYRAKAFFPDRTPYLGRTVRQEPVCQTNVLSPDRRHL